MRICFCLVRTCQVAQAKLSRVGAHSCTLRLVQCVGTAHNSVRSRFRSVQGVIRIDSACHVVSRIPIEIGSSQLLRAGIHREFLDFISDNQKQLTVVAHSHRGRTISSSAAICRNWLRRATHAHGSVNTLTPDVEVHTSAATHVHSTHVHSHVVATLVHAHIHVSYTHLTLQKIYSV